MFHDAVRCRVFRFAVAGAALLSSVGRSAAADPPAPIDRLPRPTGTYACGRTTLAWTDEAREEMWTPEAGDHRRLLVTLWYPAEAVAGSPTGPYFPRAEQLPGGPKGFDGGLARRLLTHSVDEAPLAGGEQLFPVVVFSPGAGAAPFYYTTLVEELASHGYIVAAIDHCFEGRGQVFADGTGIPNTVEGMRPDPQAPDAEKLRQEHYRRRVEVRAADAKSVVDRLTQLNADEGRFRGRLDLARLGSCGHSIGGVAAAQACLIDARFRAAVNLDGLTSSRPYIPPADGTKMAQTLLYLGKPLRFPSAEQLAARDMAPEEGERIRKDAEKRQRDLFSSVEGGAFRVLFAGALHSSFSDEVYFFPVDLAEKERITRLTREYLVGFFDQTLRARPSALYESTTAAPAGVQFDQYPAVQ